jgi:hypothetical protein
LAGLEFLEKKLGFVLFAMEKVIFTLKYYMTLNRTAGLFINENFICG